MNTSDGKHGPPSEGLNDTDSLNPTDSESGGDDSSAKIPKRETWSSQRDFLIAAIGCAVGLGNIWRFPYLCYKNGGGAFLVPYVISLICIGAPVLVLEISLGQYMGAGVVQAWRLAPAFQGIGMASQFVLFWVNMYYVIVLAWAIYYFAISLTSYLPWASCDNDWNTPRCFTTGMNKTVPEVFGNLTGNDTSSAQKPVDAVVEFWERRVLQVSEGVDSPGHLVWGLVIALGVAWLLTYLCVCRGVRWTGKIVYFTALFPYVLLTTLLIRGLTLPGAGDGLIYFIKPDFGKLADSQVWVSAFSQVLYSMAITFGFMVTLGGYNKFNFNCVRNCIVITCVNSGTSLYGGMAVFTVLGFMAKEQNVSISDVAESGPGLVFIAYPKAITQMPLAPFWSALFFFMIILVGLDSQFVSVEGLLTPIIDRYPHILRRTRNRMIFVAIYCVLCFLLGFSMVTQGGVYVFQILDYYSCSGMVLLWICLFETVVVGWVFGSDRFYDALELMIGYRVSPWLKICWKFVVPVSSLGMFIFYSATFEPLVYNRTYQYPLWAHVFGIGIGVVSMSCIPIGIVMSYLSHQGSFVQRWRAMTTPILKDHQIVPSWKERGLKWTRDKSSVSDAEMSVVVTCTKKMLP